MRSTKTQSIRNSYSLSRFYHPRCRTAQSIHIKTRLRLHFPSQVTSILLLLHHILLVLYHPNILRFNYIIDPPSPIDENRGAVSMEVFFRVSPLWPSLWLYSPHRVSSIDRLPAIHLPLSQMRTPSYFTHAAGKSESESDPERIWCHQCRRWLIKPNMGRSKCHDGQICGKMFCDRCIIQRSVVLSLLRFISFTH